MATVPKKIVDMENMDLNQLLSGVLKANFGHQLDNVNKSLIRIAEALENISTKLNKP